MGEAQGLRVKCGSNEVYFKEGGIRGYRTAVFLATSHDVMGMPLDAFVCAYCGYAEVRIPPQHMAALQSLVGDPAEGWTFLGEEEEPESLDPPGHS